jgi:DNA-binding transcriptional regulator/RsmH inhibitor MraZ
MEIPQSLKTFAGLENQIVLVGQGDLCEIWSPAGWDKQNAELLNFDKNANRFASLDLALC